MKGKCGNKERKSRGSKSSSRSRRRSRSSGRGESSQAVESVRWVESEGAFGIDAEPTEFVVANVEGCVPPDQEEGCMFTEKSSDKTSSVQKNNVGAGRGCAGEEEGAVGGVGLEERQASSSTEDGNAAADAQNYRERFNRRNQRVVPLRRAHELVLEEPYRILGIARANTQFGASIRVLIEDQRSPVGRSFMYLPSRFRDMSDEDLQAISKDVNEGKPVCIVYKGRIGRADMVEIV